MFQTITLEEYKRRAKVGSEPSTDRWRYNGHTNWSSGYTARDLLVHDVRGLLGVSTHDSVGWG